MGQSESTYRRLRPIKLRMSDRAHHTLLVLVNAFAAACSFVAALLLAGRVPSLLAFPTMIVGFVGLGYFIHQAERHRAWRRR